MNDSEFNKKIRILNSKYKILFQKIPCITDYSCSREEYVEALKKAVLEKQSLDNYVKRYK